MDKIGGNATIGAAMDKIGGNATIGAAVDTIGGIDTTVLPCAEGAIPAHANRAAGSATGFIRRPPFHPDSSGGYFQAS
jgi:hypothetical protein